MQKLHDDDRRGSRCPGNSLPLFLHPALAPVALQTTYQGILFKQWNKVEQKENGSHSAFILLKFNIYFEPELTG